MKDRDVDCLIAEKVFSHEIEIAGMAFPNFDDRFRLHNIEGSPVLPYYSTNIVAAFDVLVKLNMMYAEVKLSRESVCGVRYDCTIYDNHDCKPIFNSTADTPAMAICLSALKAVGHEAG